MSISTTTSSSRHHRKQRFPRLDRRKLFHDVYRSPSPSDLEADRLSGDGEYMDDDGDTEFYCKRPRLSVPVVPSSRPSTLRQPTATVASVKRHSQHDSTSCRLDKRARDEHNEQERSRRRELAVIYELIRCSFSEEDLRHLGQCSGPKSVEKLSYPQVLQIAYQLLLEEQHNLIMFEKSLQAIKLVEKEYLQVGLPIPQRPFCPAIPDSHRKVIQVVDSLLKQDKSARTPDGVYEVTPAQRAAIGDHQLSSVFPPPASTDHEPTTTGGHSRSGFATAQSASVAMTGRPKSSSSQLSRPGGSLVITNGPLSRVQHRSSGGGRASANVNTSATQGHHHHHQRHHRSAFKPSTSQSDSSSAAGSPRAASSGFVDSSLADGSDQQRMVFDWLGLKDSNAVDDEEVAECEAVHQPLQRRWCPPANGAPRPRLIQRTSNNLNGQITWRVRQQDPSEDTDGLVIDVVPNKSNRSLVSCSSYSNV